MPRTKEHGPAPDWDRLYEVAAPQAGHFTLTQARVAGYSPPLLAYHLREGRIERVGRAIFRMTHYPPGEHEDLVVAWLWSDRLGVFSHETALMLHGLSDALPARRHLTVPATWAHRRLRVPTGVVLHFAEIASPERAWQGPVPITTPLRTILDCKTANAEPKIVSQAVDEALHRGLFTRAELRQAMAAGRARVPERRAGP